MQQGTVKWFNAKTCQIYKKVLEVLGGFCYAAGNCKMV